MNLDCADACECDVCGARDTLLEQTELTRDDLQNYSKNQLKSLLYGLQTGLFDGEKSDDGDDTEYVTSPWDETA